MLSATGVYCGPEPGEGIAVGYASLRLKGTNPDDQPLLGPGAPLAGTARHSPGRRSRSASAAFGRFAGQAGSLGEAKAAQRLPLASDGVLLEVEQFHCLVSLWADALPNQRAGTVTPRTRELRHTVAECCVEEFTNGCQ